MRHGWLDKLFALFRLHEVRGYHDCMQDPRFMWRMYCYRTTEPPKAPKEVRQDLHPSDMKFLLDA